MIMKFLTAFTVLMLTTLAGFGATYRYPVAMNTSNGVAFGRLTVNDHINATNSLRTNTFAGPIQQRGKATGSDSAAFGLNTYAGGLAFVTGLGNEGFGPGVLVGGVSNTVHTFGRYSLVGGAFNTASSPHNFAVGDHNLVNGVGSSAIGRNNQFDGDAHNSIAIGNAIQMLSGASNNVAISAGTNGLVVSGSDSFFVKANGGSFFSGGPITGDGSGLTNIPQSGLSGELWFTNTAEADSVFTPYSTTIGGRIIATNTSANGGTNQITGSLNIGGPYFAAVTDERLTIINNVTNPAQSNVASVWVASKFASTTNHAKLQEGLVSVASVGVANTGDWTQTGYPSLMGLSGTAESLTGSAGTVRMVAGVASSVGGPAVYGDGATIGEAVMFWGDTFGESMTNVVGVKLNGLNHGLNATALFWGADQTDLVPAGFWGIYDNIGYPSYYSGHVAIGSTNAVDVTNTLSVVAGTLGTTSKAMSISATMPNTASSETGSDIVMTSAGTGGLVRAHEVLLLPGYTGSSTTIGTRIVNSSLGTGALAWNLGSGNYGATALSAGTTTGHRTGLTGSSSGSSTMNMGLYGRATSSSGTPATNIGVAGNAFDGSVASIGGFFGLMAVPPGTLTSAALMADNGANTDPIIIWRDNGSVVGGVIDGGAIYGNGLGITNIPQSGLSGALWFTNPAAASSISNAYNVSASTIAAVNTLSGQTLLATTETRSPIYRGATASSAFTLGTATTASISALSTGGVSITNTATANTALTLNGSASGGTGHVIVYRTNNVDLFVLNAAGNVGIGTTSPGELLDISKSQDGFTIAKISNVNNGISARTGLQLTSNAGGSGYVYTTGGSYTGISDFQDGMVISADSGLSRGIVLFSQNKISLQTSAGIDTMTIKSGNVGIGINDPTNKLQVIGAIQSTTTVFANTAVTTNGATLGALGTSVAAIRHGISGAMVLGTVTVTDPGCTANTRYFFTAHTLGTISIPGGYYASTRTAATSFVITSSQATETSTIDWMAIEP